MPRKSLLTIIFTTLFAIILFLGYGIVNKLVLKKKIKFNTQTLSNVSLFDLDSSAYHFPVSAPIILINFNSTCEYCQFELTELKANIDSFNKSQVILMSSENLSIIKQVSEKFGFADLPNIHFVKINYEETVNKFHSLSLPHIFIYSKDRKLVKEFRGETKVEKILKHLP